jgi:hypothetical protein
MATITKNRNFFKWPKRLYFKPESAQIWTVISIMMSFLTYITGFFYELWPFAYFDRLCKLAVMYFKKLIITLIQFKFEHFLA